MKIIPKYLVGGVSVTTPILPSVAQAIEQSNAQKSSNSDSSSGSKKSYIEQIFDTKAKMLASDAAVMGQLASSVGDLEASPVFQGMSKSQQFAAVYNQYITKASMAQTNYENLLSAKDHIIKNEASGEAAFSNDGYMFVHRDGDQEVSMIHPSQFNRKKDIPVTNAELLYLRANNPKFAFNDKITASLISATSMKEIRDIIGAATAKLNSITTENEHFVNPYAPNSKEALQELAAANITQEDLTSMDVGTLLKVKLKNSSNRQAIAFAIKSVEAQLTPQQRALLQLRAKEIGGKTTAESIIVEYINSMLSSESSFTIGLETTKSGGKGSGSGGSGNGKEESLDNTVLPPVVEWMAGRGHVEMHRISNGSRGSLFVPGNEMTITKGGGPAGIMNLFELGESSFAGALKLSQATVGGVTVDLAKRQHVIVDGNEIVNMPLPIDQAALAQNIIRPDFEAMDRFSTAWRELKSMGIDGSNPADINKINQVLQKYQLPGLYVGIKNGAPVINLTQYRRFGVINGFVDGAILGDNAVFNSALTKVEGNEADALLKQFKNHYKGYKGNERGGFIFGWGAVPDLYKAAIFIPIRDSYVNAYAGSGTNLNAGQSSDIIRREYDLQNRQQNPVKIQSDFYGAQY